MSCFKGPYLSVSGRFTAGTINPPFYETKFDLDSISTIGESYEIDP